jgi:protein-S-isoprenylcysteine O-methyltransferase Ste14
MNKREIRVIILLIVVSLIAVSFSVFFPRPELWTLVISGIALLATVIMLVVLWKAVLRQRADHWRGRQSPKAG